MHNKLRQISFNTRWVFIYLFCINILVLSILNLFIRPFFQTNDDVAMMLRLSGKLIIERPTANILFTNIVIAYPLKLLYKFIPSLPWYGIGYFTLLALSLTTITYVFLQVFEKKKVLFYTTVFYFFFGVVFITIWQFTLLAGINFIAGFSAFYFYQVYCRARKVNKNNLILVIGSSHLIFCALIRFEVLILSLLVVFPIVCYYLFARKIFYPAIGLVCVAGLCFCINLINIYIINARYSNYYDYNKARGIAAEFRSINCISADERNRVFNSLGWAENDVTALKNFFFINENTFSYKKLKKFAELTKNCVNEGKISDTLRAHASMAYENLFYYLSFLSAGLLVIFYKPVRKLAVVYFIMFLWCYLILTCIAIFLKYPDMRVQYPVLVLAFVCTLLHASFGQQNTDNKNKFAFTTLLLLGIITISGSIYNLYVQSKNKIVKEKELMNFFEKQKSIMPIINTGQAITFEALSPYLNLSKLNNYSIISLGCMQQSEEDKNYLKSFGALNIEDAIYNKKFPITISGRECELYKNLIVYYAKTDYLRQIEFDTLIKSDDIIVLRIK